MKTFALCIVSYITVSLCPAILIKPPGRNSLWRFGYDAPRLLDDEQPSCSTFSVNKKKNEKCRICGEDDSFGSSKDKTRTIVENYIVGQEIVVKFNVSGNVGGFSVFRLCNADDLKEEEDLLQECLNRNILYISGSMKQSRYYVPFGSHPELLVRLQLPPGLSCHHCLLQWTHTGDKNEGKCLEGKKKSLCKRQLIFRGCADVSIKQGDSNVKEITNSFKTHLVNLQSLQDLSNEAPTSQMTEDLAKLEIRKDNHNQKIQRMKRAGMLACEPTPTFAAVSGAKQWCQDNCNHVPPHCPKDHCLCSGAVEPECFPTTFFSAYIGAKEWCQANCNRIPRYCPPTFCECIPGSATTAKPATTATHPPTTAAPPATTTAPPPTTAAPPATTTAPLPTTTAPPTTTAAPQTTPTIIETTTVFT